MGVIAGVAKDRADDEAPSPSRRILESLLDGLGGGSDPKQTLLRFVEDLGRGTGSDRCGLLFQLPLDRDPEFASTDLFWNAPGIKVFDGVRARFRGNRVIEDLLIRRETILFQDCAADSRLERYRDLCREFDLASLLLQPLVVRGETRGMLALHRCGAPRAFRPDEVDRVREVALIAAVVIDHLLLWERERRRNSHLQILLEVQSRVARLSDLLELSRSAAETIHRAEPQFSVAVRLIDEAGGDLRSVVRAGSGGEGGKEKGPPAGGGAAAALEAARTGRSRLIPDRGSDPGCGWLDPG